MNNISGSRTGIFVLWVIACFFIAPLYSLQNSISIDSNVDKSTIRIGDLVKYTIVVTRSPDVEVEMPGLAANLGTFEIRDYQVHDPETIDGQTVDRIEYVISTFDVGEFEIPPLTFHYTLSGDSTRHELKTKALNITVESLKPSEAGDIRDIKPPLELPRNYRKFIIWGSIALGALVLIVALIYIWRRKRAGKGILPEKVEPPRPAHEVALEELNALKDSTLLAEGRVKEYYIRVSEIIRHYIEGRYFIVALELTTTELIENLRSAEIDVEHEHLIHEFLELCDLVKFAKFQPSEQENADVLDRAFEIVEKTKLIYDRPEEETETSEQEVSESEASTTDEEVLAENVEEPKS
ncbi:protein BatD [candidate division KSB1 bacterium]|nr:protein BatD [candidate division KSB1 bacterium]NIR71482.1 protein BatD [candidate division KSB1 bacterium]NIS23403.1 protein BatD [candidate division KSB1 bacterium]NIT70294.1 protein BatD [candidate division KSB1 bacterium]NIU24017.1 protein BatD [candidate division KSB1 bacterium]